MLPSRFFRFVSRRYTPTGKQTFAGHVQRHAQSRVPTRFRRSSSLAAHPPAETLLIKPENPYDLRKSGLGAAFAFGWTPCVGPVLASILVTAATTATVTRGALL
ncbi:MAG: cytochrome c biogenesis protein CcdA, partial [Pseudonocardiaceae bacterium]